MYLDRLNPLFIRHAVSKSKKATVGDGGFRSRATLSRLLSSDQFEKNSIGSNEYASSRRAIVGSPPDSVNEDDEEPDDDEESVNWKD